jgi:cellulose synthase/poly-beta-1,6-N-acetylglucosamine synthase-like glycosyltransferase
MMRAFGFKTEARYTCALSSLSIVIPAYNEEKRLPSTMDSVFAFLAARAYVFTELLVVDDGSSDATAAIVEERARPFAGALQRQLVSVHQAPLRELSGRVFILAMRLVTDFHF